MSITHSAAENAIYRAPRFLNFFVTATTYHDRFLQRSAHCFASHPFYLECRTQIASDDAAYVFVILSDSEAAPARSLRMRKTQRMTAVVITVSSTTATSYGLQSCCHPAAVRHVPLNFPLLYFLDFRIYRVNIKK